MKEAVVRQLTRIRAYVERLEARVEARVEALELSKGNKSDATATTTSLNNIEQQLQELTKYIKESKSWTQVAIHPIAHIVVMISTPKI